MNIRTMGKVKEAGEFAFSLWHFGRAIGAIVIGISMIMCMGLLDEEYEGMTERAYAIITSVDTPAVEMKDEFEGEEYQVRTLVKDTSLARIIALQEIIWAGQSFMKGSQGISGAIWPLFFTAVYYLLFNGVLTILQFTTLIGSSQSLVVFACLNSQLGLLTALVNQLDN